jgi:hypothetical protein
MSWEDFSGKGAKRYRVSKKLSFAGTFFYEGQTDVGRF